MILVVVAEFKNSDALASAYGIAVSTTMLVTTILLFKAMTDVWKWSLLWVLPVISMFISIDLIFCVSNMSKFLDGGWLPLALGGFIFYIMYIWNKGSTFVFKRLNALSVPIEYFLLQCGSIARVPGTAIFLSKQHTDIPPSLLHHILKNKSLHKNVIILNIAIAKVPRIQAKDRLTIYTLGEGLWRVQATYGFMQTPNVPVLVGSLEKLDLPCKPDKVTYYVGHEHIIGNDNVLDMQGIEQFLFTFMASNSAQIIDYFKLPDNQVIEIGIRIEV